MARLLPLRVGIRPLPGKPNARNGNGGTCMAARRARRYDSWAKIRSQLRHPVALGGQLR
jgi:hypothetical protein